MRIRELTAHVVRLPLKRAFHHASASRSESDNVLIRCTLENGVTGWGEGVPRIYVTGETPEGCLNQLSATPLPEQLSKHCNSWPDVVRLCEDLKFAIDRDDPRGCYGNALRCAVELSILDAFGQLLGEPIRNVVDYVEPAKPIHADNLFVTYSAVIDSGRRKLWRKSLVRRLYGFKYCKIKVGAQGDDDAGRLQTIRRWSGPTMDLRIDANEAWHATELVSKIERLRRFQISSIEQPVPHAEVEALREMRSKVGIPIMLDESLTGTVDAEHAIANGTCDLFNIRLSKCGGYIRSLKLAALADSAGLGYQLGCHPGESGILSAAGRHWASTISNIRYVEGSYDKHLFRRLLTNEDMTFGYGGRAPKLESPGLGVTINRDVLNDCIVSRRQFQIG